MKIELLRNEKKEKKLHEEVWVEFRWKLNKNQIEILKCNSRKKRNKDEIDF